MKETETNEVADIIRMWQKWRKELWKSKERTSLLVEIVRKAINHKGDGVVESVHTTYDTVEILEDDMLEILDRWGSVKGADYKSFLDYAIKEKGGSL